MKLMKSKIVLKKQKENNKVLKQPEVQTRVSDTNEMQLYKTKFSL